MTNSVRFFKEKNYSLSESINPPIIITDNLRTPENLGQIIRLAGNIGCKKVLAINEDNVFRVSRIKRMAEVAGKVIDWEFCTKEEALEQISTNYKIVALETASTSENIFNAELPQNIALVVGNESKGISDFWLNKADYLYHIPMTGKIKSLNVSHATSVFLFEWLRRNYV